MQVQRRQFRAGIIAACALAMSALACSGVNDVIGQRPARPTPTAPSFATATPGGRISVMLVDDPGSGRPTATPFGQIVAPAATATALSGTIMAATATAGATLAVPLFAPDASECPKLGAPPQPPRPDQFNQFAEVIGRYLSAGGPPALLEGMLRNWNAISDGAVVQADTDLTGDGVPEIIVTLYDPALFQAGQLSAGDLLVFGCAQGGYRLLYGTEAGPGVMIPELRRVGDMNGDVRAELVYTQRTCEAIGCTERLYILSWNAVLGVFRALNDTTVDTTNARIAIADLDGDGVLEVSVSYTPIGDLAAGPQRRALYAWDWDGVNYRLAQILLEPAVYRIHELHDADYRFAHEEWANAIRSYDRVRENGSLLPWNLPDEAIKLRAYATYKKMLAQIANGQRRNAANTFNALMTENPPGSPGEGYALVAQAFMDNYNRTRNPARACAAALPVITARPDTLIALNSYGYSNRTYNAADLCPFS